MASWAKAVSLGLRYAQFTSRSAVHVLGTPDWYFPDVANSKYPTDTHSEYDASLDSVRQFEGIGPVLSWEAAKRLFGDSTAGHVDIDWSVTGGALFGKQTVRAEGNRQHDYITHSSAVFGPEVTTTLYNEPISFSRTEDVTVPTLGASLGLSYAIDRVKVGAGYRWERYFDALDGGVEAANTFDRGMDGPYFKVSVGFGG